MPWGEVAVRADLDGTALEFFDGIEVCQGGPLVFKLLVNNTLIEGHQFDASPLALEGEILVPMRKRGFFKSGYVLARIDAETASVQVISKVHEYMRLVRVEGPSVVFETTAWGDQTARCLIK